VYYGPDDPLHVGAVQVDGKSADRAGAQAGRAGLANEYTAAVEHDELAEALEQDLQRRLELHRNSDSGKRLQQQINV
jgi:hypothetical protein